MLHRAQLRWAMLVGLGVMVAMLAVSSRVAAHLAMLRAALVKLRDARLGTMTEVIGSVQVIKVCSRLPGALHVAARCGR